MALVFSAMCRVKRNKRQSAAKKKGRRASPKGARPPAGHQRRFDQLLDDAILGIPKK
jgi:hypothetical protein